MYAVVLLLLSSMDLIIMTLTHIMYLFYYVNPGVQFEQEFMGLNEGFPLRQEGAEAAPWEEPSLCFGRCDAMYPKANHMGLHHLRQHLYQRDSYYRAYNKP